MFLCKRKAEQARKFDILRSFAALNCFHLETMLQIETKKHMYIVVDSMCTVLVESLSKNRKSNRFNT